MISIEEALHTIQDQEFTSAPITSTVSDSLGSYLAQEIYAPFDIPSFDNSAMDGYAVCGVGKSYTVIGEIAAGDTGMHQLKPGEAMRIFTGGRTPINCTAVVMQEKTKVNGQVLELEEEITEGKNIRRKGEELAKGQLVFEKGHAISPGTIGLLNSIGRVNVDVFEKPTVRIIATGDELVKPGSELKEGQIYASNGETISGALKSYGFACKEHIQIQDDYPSILQGIKNCLDSSDVLLLSGGISVGEYDFVKKALEENGVEEVFYKVFQKPGKPLFFGRKENKCVFGLPGNPASSLTCFYVYVLPLLQKMAGGHGTGLRRVFIPLQHSFEMKSDRPSFLKAHLSGKEVSILDGQGSSMIHSMANGNALVYLKRPASLEKGDLVECLLF